MTDDEARAALSVLGAADVLIARCPVMHTIRDIAIFSVATGMTPVWTQTSIQHEITAAPGTHLELRVYQVQDKA